MSKSNKYTSKLPFISTYSVFLLLSLGFHSLLLGLVLPKISDDSVKEAQYQQESIVPVIELNALEQSRIPVSSSLIEEIPGLSDNSGVNSAIPTPNNPPFVPALPPPPPPPTPQIVYAPPPLIPVNPANSPANSQTITPPPPSPSPAEVTAKESKDQDKEIIETKNTTPAAPKPTVEEQKKLVATRQKSLLQSIEEKAKLLQEDKLNTTDEEAETNKANWLSTLQGQTVTELEMVGVYPVDACLKKLSGTAVYGVSVDQEGKVIESALIKSSGYGIFNEQVKETIEKIGKDYAMEANKPYQVSVKFEYDEKVCPSISVTNLQKGPKPQDSKPLDSNSQESQPNQENPQQ